MGTKRTAAASSDPYPQHGLARIPEVVAYLNTSPDTVYRLIKSGKLEAVKVGGTLRVKWEVLRAFA